MGEHLCAGDAAPLRLVDAEHAAQITEARRRKQCVAQRMDRDIAVGMTGATIGAVEQQAEQPAGPAGLDWVYVGSDTNPGERVVHELNTARANRRSSGVVILNASTSPSTV